MKPSAVGTLTLKSSAISGFVFEAVILYIIVPPLASPALTRDVLEPATIVPDVAVGAEVTIATGFAVTFTAQVAVLSPAVAVMVASPGATA